MHETLPYERLAEIARRTLGIPTLATRGSDRLDFHEVAAASVLEALRLAYQAGTPATPAALSGGMHMSDITILVSKEKIDHFSKQLDYEVLAFATREEFENCTTETEIKKRIHAKFRDYQDAFDYAHRLGNSNVYYYKVILRA